MTVQNPAIFLQTGSHPAEDVRQGFRSLMAYTGVVASTSSGAASTIADLKVSQRGAGANMSVDVANGRCAILGTEGTYQGVYLCDNRGTTNLTIGAAAASARIDRIVARVQDSSYSGATNAWALSVVAGTPSAVPVAPTAPSNSITLALVAVSAGATSIVNANITDSRPYAATLGATQRTNAAPSSAIGASLSGHSAYNEADYGTYEYTTATSGWQKPWRMPWGLIAYGSTTTNQTGISTETDLTSLTAALPSTWPANRYIRVRVSLPALSGTSAGTSAAGAYILYIKTSGGTQVASSTWIPGQNGDTAPCFAEAIITPSSGATTYKATLLRFGGSGTGSTGAATTSPATFILEDLGPSSNPA